MKKFILFFGLLLTMDFLFGQLKFYGVVTEVKPLNSKLGENNLCFDRSRDAKLSIMRQIDEATEINDEIKITFPDAFETVVFYDQVRENKQKKYPVGFDPEGYCYYAKIIFNEVSYKTGIYKLSDDGDEKKISIPYLDNKSRIISGHISGDGQIMLLSIEGNDSKGVEDIYVVKKEGNKWSSPRNLGSKINTKYQELTPFLNSTNDTLYFSTNGRKGEGGLDVFWSKRLDDTWINWTQPQNLGYPINNSGSQTSFTLDKNRSWAYFIDNQDSDGYGEIKRVKITLGKEKKKKNESVDGSAVFLHLKDSKTKAFVGGDLIFENQRITSSKGIFRFAVSEVSKLQKKFEIKSKGYFSKLIQFSPKETVWDDTLTVTLEATSKGSILSLESVLFARGTDKMLDGSSPQLDLVVELLQENKNMKIQVNGHTDNQGNSQANLNLSQRRVDRVIAYFIEKGINKKRIKGKGYGGTQPAVDNSNINLRKLNRRVEFEILQE